MEEQQYIPERSVFVEQSHILLNRIDANTGPQQRIQHMTTFVRFLMDNAEHLSSKHKAILLGRIMLMNEQAGAYEDEHPKEVAHLRDVLADAVRVFSEGPPMMK